MRYPQFLQDVYSVPPLSKPPRDGILNLSSNELLHPDLGSELDKIVHESFDWRTLATYATYGKALRSTSDLLHVDPKNVILSAGSDDAIRTFIEAFCAKTKSVILHVPNYEGWKRHSAIRGVDAQAVSLRPDIGASANLKVLLRHMCRTNDSVVAISNPNSPTGLVFDADQVRELSRMAQRQNHILLIDECYWKFVDEDDDEVLSNTIRLRSLSKSHGIAGLRFAYAFGPLELIDYASRFRPEYNLSHFALSIIPMLQEREQVFSSIRKEVMATSPFLVTQIRRLRPSWVPLPSAGNFLNFKTSSSSEAADVVQRLFESGVRVRNTDEEENLDHCIRITLGHKSILEPCLKALERVGGH